MHYLYQIYQINFDMSLKILDITGLIGVRSEVYYLIYIICLHCIEVTLHFLTGKLLFGVKMYQINFDMSLEMLDLTGLINLTSSFCVSGKYLTGQPESKLDIVDR